MRCKTRAFVCSWHGVVPAFMDSRLTNSDEHMAADIFHLALMKPALLWKLFNSNFSFCLPLTQMTPKSILQLKDDFYFCSRHIGFVAAAELASDTGTQLHIYTITAIMFLKDLWLWEKITITSTFQYAHGKMNIFAELCAVLWKAK